jgi:NAD(P)-dependent dehydrogenase (short-subunit alcohol dehydrogenase family)
MLLKDRVCVIVGAASTRSIGYATAELFARHGAVVAAVDVAMDEAASAAVRSSIERETARPAELYTAGCDIRRPVECDELIQAVVSRYGSVDCLVNCAGIVASRPMLEIEDADYDRMLEVNLKGTFNICRSALRVFVDRGRGAVVNLASVAAQRGGGLVGGAHYAASKGGVISLTRSIAREFGPKGIRANVVCPSMTETGMLDGNVTPGQFKDIVASIPLRRAGRASDVAGACLFLASDLSAYVTGTTLDVNGGSHIH